MTSKWLGPASPLTKYAETSSLSTAVLSIIVLAPATPSIAVAIVVVLSAVVVVLVAAVALVVAIMAPDGFRLIEMFSHQTSNLSLVPVCKDDFVLEHKLSRYSFTTGERYDERTAVSGLLSKLVDGSCYAKYHPNMMLSMFGRMSSVHPPGAASSSGVEESKFEPDDETAGPVGVLYPTGVTDTNPADPAAEELRDYRLRFPNRTSYVTCAPKSTTTATQAAIDDHRLHKALDDSRAASDFARLDAERERELILMRNCPRRLSAACSSPPTSHHRFRPMTTNYYVLIRRLTPTSLRLRNQLLRLTKQLCFLRTAMVRLLQLQMEA